MNAGTESKRENFYKYIMRLFVRGTRDVPSDTVKTNMLNAIPKPCTLAPSNDLHVPIDLITCCPNQLAR